MENLLLKLSDAILCKKQTLRYMILSCIRVRSILEYQPLEPLLTLISMPRIIPVAYNSQKGVRENP
jgi:hypothetical protein